MPIWLYSWCHVGSPVLALALNWIGEFCIARPWLFPSWRHVDVTLLRRVAGLGALWTWFQFMSFIGTAADNFIIAYIFGQPLSADSR